MWINRNIDKIAHFSVSFMILIILNLFLDLSIALFLTILIGIVKECYDEIKTNHFSYKDIIANFLGIILGLIVIYFYNE